MLDSLDNPACRDVCCKLWKGLRFKLRQARYTHCVILEGFYDVVWCKGSAEDIFKNIDKLAKVAKDCCCETFVMTIPELREEKNHRNMENILISDHCLLIQSESLNTIDLSTVVSYHRFPARIETECGIPTACTCAPQGTPRSITQWLNTCVKVHWRSRSFNCSMSTSQRPPLPVRQPCTFPEPRASLFALQSRLDARGMDP
jgi:hypothetical protein